MPNWCENQLHFDCSDEEFEEKIRPLLKGRDIYGEERELTFNALVPMPAHIYRGDVGEDVRKTYGKNNWYDWSCEHWGTKWDADQYSVRVDPGCVQFSTAWNPPTAWLRVLAEALAPLGIEAHMDYYVEGGFPGSLGAYDLIDGEVLEGDVDEEFAEAYAYEDEEEEE